MKSSSEDSFTWAITSSDKSESEAMANEEESDFDKHYKKKLLKELFLNGDVDGSQEETPQRKKKKKIKREKDSPAAIVKQESDSDARLSVEAAVERSLRLKAERELAGDAAPRAAEPADSADSGTARPHKKKRAKREPRDEPDAGEPPPKKKKHKRETFETNGIEPIVDKFEAEETVVETRRRTAPAAACSAPADKPFTSKEFVDTDSDSDAPAERRAPGAPRTLVHSEQSDAEIVTRSSERSPKRALKIRERITYEEESQDRLAPESPGSPRAEPAPGGRLARYQRAHAHLQAVRGAESARAALGADDDVWLVRAPGSLRAAALAGAELALGARCKLRAGGRAYEAAPAACLARAALLLPGGGARVRGVRLRGALQLRVRVPRARAPAAAPPAEPEPVPLPPTRARHPLLGAAARADAPTADAPDRHPLLGAAARTPPGADPPADRHEKKKKKKKEKRKRSRSEAEAPPRGARAPRAGELWDSAAAIEESLFNY